MSRKRLEIKEGERYGRLTVIREVEPHVNRNGKKERRILCKCDCDGKEVKVRLADLRSGKTKSCGCLQKEKASKNITEINKSNNNNKNLTLNTYEENHKLNCLTVYSLNDNGRFLIDYEDYERIKDYRWFMDKNGYARATIGGRSEQLHRIIMNCPKDMIVDHINRDPSDNRKQNLRICTQSENTMNLSIKSNNTSGVTGVSFDKKSSKWSVRIKVGEKRLNLGFFDNFEEAVKVRTEAELKYFGEFSPNYYEEKLKKSK